MLHIRFHEKIGNRKYPSELFKIAEIIEQFVDQFRQGKEEKTATFLKQEATVLLFREEIRKFVIGQEFGRRIARRVVRLRLEEFLQGHNRATRSLS